MKNKMIIILTAWVSLLGCRKENPINKIDFKERCNLFVLEEDRVGQTYFFKMKSNDEALEYEIKYLGVIKGRNFKVLNVIHYFGKSDSRRANSSVRFYNIDNNYLGKYLLGSISSLPEKINGTELIFNYHNSECNQLSKVNLKDSIPHEMFVGCTENGGDLYYFTKDE